MNWSKKWFVNFISWEIQFVSLECSDNVGACNVRSVTVLNVLCPYMFSF